MTYISENFLPVRTQSVHVSRRLATPSTPPAPPAPPMCIYCEWISVSNLPRNTRKVKYLDDYMMECHDGPDDRFVAPSWLDLTTNLVPHTSLVGAPASAPSAKRGRRYGT